MADRPKKSVFVIAACGHAQNTLDGIPASCSMSLTHFSTVTDCRRSLRTEVCDLLIVDLDGNTQDSLRLLIDSEHLRPHMPALVLVDHGDMPTTAQAIKAGANNCLEKPVDVRQLCLEIEAPLDWTVSDSCRSILVLTPTEKTVLHHLLQGKSNRETANALHRSGNRGWPISRRSRQNGLSSDHAPVSMTSQYS